MTIIFEPVKTNPEKYAMVDEFGERIGTIIKYDGEWCLSNMYGTVYSRDGLKIIRRKLKELNNA